MMDREKSFALVKYEKLLEKLIYEYTKLYAKHNELQGNVQSNDQIFY